ncbi:hypothetical protein [Segetibacter aerophilus]|uniref:LPS export ABC transporter periplasmic protein LptC n=1 Tax=Segetibacter aerophilus TaxID=670293 RepID=A0A512BJU6_9BACT|nr:hypothetical protein [Segetibacter aerophilus]GEO12243.1 hypothetical protein SAE01_47390 [Segetibacter aerophilus]
MKKKFLALGTMCFLVAMVACNNGESTTTTDSTTVSTGSSQTSNDEVAASQNIRVQLDPSVSYVDLKTGKPVKLRVDTVTRYIVNEVSNEPVTYYINPATSDTFDARGRLVNRALVRSSDGDYTIDETRLTLTEDDNSNMTSTDTTTNTANTSADGTTTMGNSKTKIKDNKFKQKTDSTEIKVTEDKIKVKTRKND